MDNILSMFLMLSVLSSCESNEATTSDSVVSKRHLLPDLVQETSGLIKYNNLIWTFNDSGGKPEIYGINLSNDSIEQTITLKNAINNDWEDITQDMNSIYIGDFGNNQGTRDSLVIYKIAKASIPNNGNASLIAENITFLYAGYKPVAVPVSWSAFDCEALVQMNDSLYLFTKDWTSGSTSIYSLPKKPGRYEAKKLNTLDPQGLITGADFKDNTLILLGYSNLTPFVLKFKTNNFLKLKDSDAKRYNLKEIATYQTEGICFDGDKIIISSEKTQSPAQILELDIN